MADYNLDHTDASAALLGGVIREDVMEKIWDISKIPLPLTDILSKDTSLNQFKEFTMDELGTPATDNAHVDGIDIDQDDSQVGTRVGNYHQTSVKEIRVSTRANAAKSIGNQARLSYQVMMGQQRLRRDVEAQMCTGQASVAGDGSAIPGISAGIGAWLETNTARGAGGADGGFNTATGIVDAPTLGTPRALTETLIRDIAQMVYEEGGECQYIMGRPVVIRALSEYLFTSSARIATMTNQDTKGTDAMTAYGSTNVFVSDFAVLKFKDNRLQPQDAADQSSLYFLDPGHLKQSFMTGYRTEPLAKTGLSEKRLICVDYSLLVCNEKSQGVIADIDETAPVTDV